MNNYQSYDKRGNLGIKEREITNITNAGILINLSGKYPCKIVGGILPMSVTQYQPYNKPF